MKKKLYSSICLWFLVIITLSACGKQKQGNPIVLPDKEDIISIGVSDGEKLGVSPNTEGEADAFISEFLSILMDMEVTSKESITDIPANKSYITINLNCEDKTTTLFYYKEKDTEYVEQPYQGIYIPAPALGLLITEMFDSTDNEPKYITFQATVLEINNDTILVKPVDDSLELNSADQFSISNENNLELQVGDLIEIDYNGEIMESYPAQLGEVYEITIVEQVGVKIEPTKLTLETVKELAKKGNQLTWSDFEQYESMDIGFGLYILVYEIDENYELMIGGGSPNESPMYIRLVSTKNRDNYVDIRTNNIDDFIEQAEADSMWDRIPMVRVNGKLYYDTGRESTVDGRCGNMDGQITSEVDGSEIPTENNQSNFGIGFGYQYGEGDTIEIYMNEKWFVFEYREEKEYQSVEPTEPSVVKTYKVTDSDTAFENGELVTMVKYYEMSDGTWKTDTHTYQYRLEIAGRMGGAEKDSTFVFLSNIENISFEQAWKAAGFSSNTNDYFKEEDAKFVALK